ncbi:MAG: hypothetical protein H6709_09460 [Kofleriaceae bacterium]|nr:hypothetical protein [Kofleriaceae bacterium]MCB9572298.1 hypothetical protein [Kofleriaceae bacterium]
MATRKTPKRSSKTVRPAAGYARRKTADTAAPPAAAEPITAPVAEAAPAPVVAPTPIAAPAPIAKAAPAPVAEHLVPPPPVASAPPPAMAGVASAMASLAALDDALAALDIASFAELPTPTEIDDGAPDDDLLPPGHVPPGDVRSLRRADSGEFALVYRWATAVVIRRGPVGKRGTCRVIDYPTPQMASSGYARECTRLHAEGFGDYVD